MWKPLRPVGWFQLPDIQEAQGAQTNERNEDYGFEIFSEEAYSVAEETMSFERVGLKSNQQTLLNHVEPIDSDEKMFRIRDEHQAETANR